MPRTANDILHASRLNMGGSICTSSKLNTNSGNLQGSSIPQVLRLPLRMVNKSDPTSAALHELVRRPWSRPESSATVCRMSNCSSFCRSNTYARLTGYALSHNPCVNVVNCRNLHMRQILILMGIRFTTSGDENMIQTWIRFTYGIIDLF